MHCKRCATLEAELEFPEPSTPHVDFLSQEGFRRKIRYFLCSDDFGAFASKLYDWIQAAQPTSNEALSAGTEEPDNQSGPLHYLDRDKLQLLQMFRCLLESEARRSCTSFERRLRAELLEQALMPAEAEQVAGLIYDSLLPAEVDAWNRKLHEESVDAYWMPS